MNHSQEKIDLCNKEKHNENTRCQHIILKRYQNSFEHFSRSENDQFGILVFDNFVRTTVYLRMLSLYSRIISLLYSIIGVIFEY